MEKSKSLAEKLKQDIKRIKKEIASVGLVKKGSITKCYQACRNPNCRCNKDPKFKHGPYFLLTFKSKARTRTFAVPQGMLSEVSGYMENYKLLMSMVKQLEEISEKIIKIRIENYKMQQKKSG